MAAVKKGILTSSNEWWKHLRWTKRIFWKAERRAADREAVKEAEAKTGGSSANSKKGGVYEALRRSPLVGSEIDFPRDTPLEREIDL